jgi:hypothetical protein
MTGRWTPSAGTRPAFGSLNPKHLKLLAGGGHLYRDFITFKPPQHGAAQRGLTADDLHDLSTADQLHVAPNRTEEELQLFTVCTGDADQRTELYAFLGVVWARTPLAPIGHRLLNRLGATRLSGGQVSRFKSQCVVLVLGDVLFMRRRCVGCPGCLFGLQQVLGKLFQHLLLQQEFIHERG